jgi:hypothetical protein
VPADDGYRDALAAAHSRIEQLERALGEQKKSDSRAAALAALHRERARVAASTRPRDDWKRLVVTRVIVPVGIVGVVLAFAGDWFFASAAVVLSVATWFGVGAFVRSSAKTAERQLALVEAEIARLENELRSPGEPSSAAQGAISAGA